MSEDAPQTIQPRGLPADTRIIGAIHELYTQLRVCGLKAPVAIVVAPGELRRLEAAVAGSGWLLVADATSDKTSIWGVEIREESVRG
jgi:hypothetical protein